MELERAGVLAELEIELIGASAKAIHTAEDREAFGQAMASVGLRVPRSVIVRTAEEARAAIGGELQLPVAIRPGVHARRPRRRLRAHGGGARGDRRAAASAESPISQVLVEESVEGWGEFELEVIRDRLDNVVIVCSIENLDPMGVHTGDSVCCAPAMTLSDREYQALRDAAAKVIRAVGVETGGSNVQFAVNRESGEIVVIEMNPRVSRSSALASKATGYPIAKVATRLAIGYTLDEIPNDITGTTPASFEPTIDYVVVKAPRFAFEKFAGSDETLTTQMKSVGEAMGIGRCFNEAYGKAMRSRELDRDPREEGELDDARLGSLRRAARAPARGRGSRRALGREQRAPLVLPRARATRGARGRGRRARARRPRRRGAAAAQARGRLRRAHRAPVPLRRGGGARAAPGARRAARLQDRRLLRRRGRRRDVVPLLELRPHRRAARGRSPGGADPRLRARTASVRASSSTTAASRPCAATARRATRR